MIAAHEAQVKKFIHRLVALLWFRTSLRWSAYWFFLWGTLTLVLRMANGLPAEIFLWGWAGLVPVSLAAGVREWARRPQMREARAMMDRYEHCGGLLMAAEAEGQGAWKESVQAVRTPRLVWRSARSIYLFGAAAIFLATISLIPERYTSMAVARPLAIGQIVDEIQEEIRVLKEEEILEDPEAEAMEKKLKRMEEEASGVDPAKTWEALDHLRQQNENVARQAAEENIRSMQQLTEAEALAGALALGVEEGDGMASKAMNELASMLDAAQKENRLMEETVPWELLEAAKKGALSEKELEELLKAIQANKEKLGEGMGKLANLRLIDAKLLAECKNAGVCPNPNGLLGFLKENRDEGIRNLVRSYCRGGVNRGRGDAPMTWTDGTSEDGAEFKEEHLPPSLMAGVEDAQLVGVSRSAPDVDGADAAVEAGALEGAAAGGGAAQVQTVLPRHKGSVQRYFSRE